MTDEHITPRLIDPGEGGWAPEPKVTQAELLLFGEFAGPVRLLGQAASAAADAYSLVCKHNHESALSDRDDLYDPFVHDTYELYERAISAHRELALRAVQVTKERAAVRWMSPVEGVTAPGTNSSTMVSH